jgi:hypothetical protein
MTTNVGPAQYSRLLQAIGFYAKHGYVWKDVDWAVRGEALSVTSPKRLALNECPSYKGGYIIASAEQSFIEDQQQRVKQHGLGIRDTNRYVTITPCFRDEEVYDDVHRPYFMKVELIDWGHTSGAYLHEMINLAEEFFSEYLTVDVIENNEPDPLFNGPAFDIVSRRGRVELGSYGIRKHDSTGPWIYGTGCAEPRLSYAIEQEAKLGGLHGS